ncbi:MAG: NAD(P)/FAD-dependent oxidoreductase [Chloroflexota bacterium]
MSDVPQVVIIGAGPAGLTAAYRLLQHGVKPLILEKTNQVGGIARTERYNGFRFDIGGHRFFSKVEVVNQIWHDVLGNDFLLRPRLSRIFYKGQFFRYPLDLFDTLAKLGVVQSTLAGLSYLRWQVAPYRQVNTFEEWVTNHFGRRLYQTFFKTYTEKVWGVPCSTIQADWAAQRIKGLSLATLLKTAVFGNSNGHVKSLIDQFHYPRLGPGMMWEAMTSKIETAGGLVQFESDVVELCHDGHHVTEILLANGRSLRVNQLISSMPLRLLVERLAPQVPTAVSHAARQLRYRGFILVGLILQQEDIFPDNWLYIHSPNMRVGRIQNFKNWSLEMVPDPQMTSLGMEYFCDEGDELWQMPDDALLTLATKELIALGLAKAVDVVDGVVIRQPKAYPVYDQTYRDNLAIVRDYIARFENLQTVGRNGMHRYNNQDHSMLTGLLAADNWDGQDHDLWQVNTERSYYETFTTTKVQEFTIE